MLIFQLFDLKAKTSARQQPAFLKSAAFKYYYEPQDKICEVVTLFYPCFFYILIFENDSKL